MQMKTYIVYLKSIFAFTSPKVTKDDAGIGLTFTVYPAQKASCTTNHGY
jgi:hypothetical protein